METIVSGLIGLVGAAIGGAITLVGSYLNNRATIQKEREQWERQREAEREKAKREIAERERQELSESYAACLEHLSVLHALNRRSDSIACDSTLDEQGVKIAQEAVSTTARVP
jgi:hypothetical protein